MDFSLIVCTYMRPKPLLNLLESVKQQSLYPNEILIIDGSTDNKTREILELNNFNHLKYFKVDDSDRGLTKQRNFGISKASRNSEIICFLDDDTELEVNYFEKVVETFKSNSEIVGVGGVSVNENKWFQPKNIDALSNKRYYKINGFAVKEGLRNVVRNYLGLQSPLLPGLMPDFSHGRTNGYPLNNKIYEVDLLIGMSFSFKRFVFNNIRFSTYFEGYGLYEDADFSLRALEYGKNVVNTSAKLYHYHDGSGRPNQFKYGKMVARNGWYVWRIKNPNPNFKARLKWNLTFILLMKLRFLNVFTTKNRYKALTESFGRLIGWISLMFNKPRIL